MEQHHDQLQPGAVQGRGVEYPKDWTWEQFREVAKKLTKHDASGNVTQYGYEVPNQNFFVQPWFLTNGTSPLNADWTASNMLDPKVSETLQFLHDLIHVDKVSPIPGKDTMDNQFAAGQVAMISRGHWIVENAKRAKLDMDIADVPSKVNDDTVIGFGGYGVSKTSKNPDLAKELVGALTSEETQKEEGELGGGVPGRKSAAETPAFLAFPPSAALYYQTLPHTIPVPSPANFQEVEKIFIRNYVAMMADEISIADGVKRADQELNESFKRLAAQQKADKRRTRRRRYASTRAARSLVQPIADVDRSPDRCKRRSCAKRRICERAQARAGYLFILPSFALYVVFVLAPVVVTCILSFTYYDPMLGSRWVGFDNYVRFFTDDRSLQIFWNTLRFTLFAVTGNVCVGMLFALALNRADARLPALFLPARLFPAGHHRRGLRLDRLGLFLRRRSRRHQLLPHPPRLSPGPLADLEPLRDDVDRHHGRLEERRLLHDHLHRRAAGRAEDH